MTQYFSPAQNSSVPTMCLATPFYRISMSMGAQMAANIPATYTTWAPRVKNDKCVGRKLEMALVLRGAPHCGRPKIQLKTSSMNLSKVKAAL